MGELLAIVIYLEAESALPPWVGRSAQAWLLNTIRRVDPMLANELHATTTRPNRRPYTVSVTPDKTASNDAGDRDGSDDRPLSGPNEATRLGSDKSNYRNKYALRITSVSPALTTIMSEGIIPLILREGAIRLNGVEAEIKRYSGDDHAWSGRSSFEALAQQTLTAAEPNTTIKRFEWEFATPTAFHQQGLTVPLPLPTLVFGSLIQAWDQFSPLPLPIALSNFVERYVGISRHRIATRIVRFGKSEQHIGFVGSAQYGIVSDPGNASSEDFRQRVRLLALLSQFAFYTGVGIRTAVGMGQVRSNLK